MRTEPSPPSPKLLKPEPVAVDSPTEDLDVLLEKAGNVCLFNDKGGKQVYSAPDGKELRQDTKSITSITLTLPRSVGYLSQQRSTTSFRKNSKFWASISTA